MGPARQNRTKADQRVQKLENDVSTLCTLFDDREAELQKLAARHARLFAVVCVVAIAMFVVAVLR